MSHDVAVVDNEQYLEGVVMTSTLNHARTHRLLFGSVVALVLFSSSMASAQQGADAKMQAFIEEATEHYRNGQYADAARSFEAAYEAKNEPVLIKNAMVAWFADDQNCEMAQARADQYLKLTQLQPSESDPAEVVAQVNKDKRDAKTVIVKCSIKNATIALSEGRLDDAHEFSGVAVANEPQGEDSVLLAKLQKNIREEEKRVRDQQGQSGNGGPVVPPPTTKSNPARTAGFVMLGAGLVGGAIVGTRHGVIASNASHFAVNGKFVEHGYGCGPDRAGKDAPPECKVAAERVPELARFETTVGKFYRNQAIFYGVSGLVAITGGVLIAMNPKEEKSMTLFPVVGPDMAGAGVSFEF